MPHKRYDIRERTTQQQAKQQPAINMIKIQNSNLTTTQAGKNTKQKQIKNQNNYRETKPHSYLVFMSAFSGNFVLSWHNQLHCFKC